MKLKVTYECGEPIEVEFYDVVYGLVRFHMVDEVAVIDDRWNEVTHRHLKDDIEPQVYTEDVVEEVRKLPFVEEVDV